MPTFRQKIGLVLDIAFPPINHMLNKYDTDKRWLLPLLYLRRGLMALLRGGPRRRP
jgi:cadmium resistance protein CadD (predicted permease)